MIILESKIQKIFDLMIIAKSYVGYLMDSVYCNDSVHEIYLLGFIVFPYPSRGYV